MDMKERKSMRNEIVREMYIYHHGECFEKKREAVLNLRDEYDKEILLALRYLDGKGFMTTNIRTNNNTANTSSDITILGIDYVENEIGLINEPESDNNT